MWFWIILIIVAIVVAVYFWNQYSKESDSKVVNNSNDNNRRYATQIQNRISAINNCTSNDDIKYQLSNNEQTIVSAINNSRNEILKISEMAKKEISTAWLDSYERVIRISHDLESNLTYYSTRNLEISKFHYYNSLYFRSMTAANIVHDEYAEIDSYYKEVNQLLLSLKGSSLGQKGLSKSKIHETKDNIKNLRQIVLNRVHEMNNNTAKLRDKIGAECGERGRSWRIERMKHK